MENQLKIKSIKVENYRFDLSENQFNGKPVCRLLQLMTRGKNVGTYKTLESFYFQNEEKRKEYITSKIERINKYKKEEQERKDAKEQAKKDFKNPFQVGEVFYDSWGYEQTNIDFYQIVEIKNKSVVFRKIGQKIVPNSEKFLSEYVTPDVNNFIGEEKKKLVKVYVNYKGEIEYNIGFFKYDRGETGIYQSHYH